MTVHELYNLKQQQYMQYKVDKGVYDSKWNEAKEALREAVLSLADKLEFVENADIKIKLSAIVDKLTSDSFDYSELSISSVKEELDAIAAEIEADIRRVLQ